MVITRLILLINYHELMDKLKIFVIPLLTIHQLILIYQKLNYLKWYDGAHVINLDEYSNIATHWIVLYVLNNDVTYFDNFGVEHIPKEIKTFISNKNIKTNIFRIEAYDSIMCV